MTPGDETPLAALLRQRIVEAGPIGVDEFMRVALSHPEFGYYATRDPLGAAGDFVTAPEISGAFGELLGLWCVAVWQAMGRPPLLRLVELGAGRGTMMADAWRAAGATAPDFCVAARLHIVETGTVLREHQRQALAALSPPPAVQWHPVLGDVPAGPLLLLANEFFDALPLRRWLRRNGAWHEHRIGIDQHSGDFAFVAGPEVGDAELGPGLPEGAADADLFEACPAAEAIIAAIATRVRTDGGAALVVDYGHARTAFGETLQAVRRHRFCDPLAAPGAADLSHHVDFARLRSAAQASGATVAGPIPQGLFLGRLGIDRRARAMAEVAGSSERADAISGAIRRLVHPGRMGVLFKAFAVADPNLPPLPGFAPRPR